MSSDSLVLYVYVSNPENINDADAAIDKIDVSLQEYVNPGIGFVRDETCWYYRKYSQKDSTSVIAAIIERNIQRIYKIIAENTKGVCINIRYANPSKTIVIDDYLGSVDIFRAVIQNKIKEMQRCIANFGDRDSIGCQDNDVLGNIAGILEEANNKLRRGDD